MSAGLGAIKHREFAMASGEMTRPEFTTLSPHDVRAISSRSASTARSTSSAWTGGTWPRCWRPPRDVYSELKNLIVWAKDNGGMGTFYRSRHELIFAFKNGTAPHINSFELGQHGRYRTNVWAYRGVNTLQARPDGRAGAASDGQAGADDRRCHQGRVRAQRYRPRPLRWQRLDAHRRPQDRSAGAISANWIRSTATASFGAGRLMPRTMPSRSPAG